MCSAPPSLMSIADKCCCREERWIPLLCRLLCTSKLCSTYGRISCIWLHMPISQRSSLLSDNDWLQNRQQQSKTYINVTNTLCPKPQLHNRSTHLLLIPKIKCVQDQSFHVMYYATKWSTTPLSPPCSHTMPSHCSLSQFHDLRPPRPFGCDPPASLPPCPSSRPLETFTGTCWDV